MYDIYNSRYRVIELCDSKGLTVHKFIQRPRYPRHKTTITLEGWSSQEQDVITKTIHINSVNVSTICNVIRKYF